MTGRVLHLLRLRTEPETLAASRIVVGICALALAWEVWRTLSRIVTPYSVPLPYLISLPRVPPGALPILATVWLVLASAFLLGFATRLAGTFLAALATYVLFLDQRTYSNHLYLFVLLVLLLTVADSGAAFSIDVRRRRPISSVAAWPVLLLKAQASLVYGFSALAKLSSQFLSGDVLAASLKTQGWPRVPDDWRSAGVMATLAATAIVVELFVGIGLWSRRWRWYAVSAGVLFHTAILTLLDSSRLSLGIFALEMFALYPLFDARLSRPAIDA
jgi:uncharacterized membrane protein YphA (DoxX/SURF4 family)